MEQNGIHVMYKRVLKPFNMYAFIVILLYERCMWFVQSDKAGPLLGLRNRKIVQKNNKFLYFGHSLYDTVAIRLRLCCQ